MRVTSSILLLSIGLCAACQAYDVPGSGKAKGGCCGGAGTCIPQGFAPSALSERLGQDACGEALLCAPSAWLNDPEALPPRCRSTGEREGRCLPSCLPEVAKQADRLVSDRCDEEQLCVPCFDPLTGADTGACRTGKDRPMDKPNPFATCCEGAGRCVPEEALAPSVSQKDAQRLSHDSCADGDALCIPEAWLDPERSFAESCRAAGDLEGRCLASCLPEVASQAATLARETCTRTELCVPCYDPFSGQDTEACRIGADRPREQPHRFERCCGTRGFCVPEQALLQSLSLADRARLDATRCAPESHALCVPESFLTSAGAEAESCRAPGDLEGRCLSTCLPEVAEQADRLQQRECDRDQRCVPCYDPLTGADTQACRNGRDKPVDPARRYEPCCGALGSELGTCLPVEILSAEQIDSLPIDSCSRSGTRCAPSEFIDGSERVGQCTAQSLGGPPSRGLCLPECLLPATVRYLTPRATCGAPRRCVPCARLGASQPGCE